MLQNKLIKTAVMTIITSFFFVTNLLGYNSDEIKVMQGLTQKQKSAAQEMIKLFSGGNPSEGDMIKAKTVFDNGLKNLINQDKKYGASFNNVLKSLKKIEKNWIPVKNSIQNNVSSTAANHADITVKLKAIESELDKIDLAYQRSVKKQMLASDLSSLVNEIIDIENKKSHVINLAGKQRMLTQKMAKESLLIVLNVNVKENKRLLKQSAEQYDKALNGFINGDKALGLLPTKTKKVLDHLKVVQEAWKPFYESVQTIVNSTKINNEALLYVVNNNEEMLKLSHKVVQLYKGDENFDTLIDKEKSNIIDIAGRQRMLTQKMLKEKILIVGGMDVTRNEGKLRGTTMLFNRSIKGLLNSDAKFGIIGATNPKIREQLSKVLAMWEKIHYIYVKPKISDKELVTLISSNVPLLNEMNKAVQLIADTVDY